MSRFNLREITGVIPAMLTPFAPNEDFCPERTKALARHLMKYDIGGLYLTGSTGEGFMMTVDERKAAAQAVIEETRGRVPVIVHVGAISTRASAELARHARDAGADAISSVPPIYWKYGDDNVAKYYADLVQESGLPMIVYNIALAGLVSFDMIKRLGAIDGVKGIKYTANGHFDYFRIREALGDDFVIYSGADEMAASGLAFGADGLIGSTYNVIADAFVAIYQAARRGDLNEVSLLQRAANRIIFSMLDRDLMPTLKLALSWMGVDAGICRRPFTQYTDAEAAAIRDAMRPLKDELKDFHFDLIEAI